eukprot:GHVL01027510.1.p2 GENE.GHVL01027510.1~~GHVL01027510.1.p2  ORF type:complete len:173 (+),score=38.67 GHVL01027510.1:519-1037(+)
MPSGLTSYRATTSTSQKQEDIDREILARYREPTRLQPSKIPTSKIPAPSSRMKPPSFFNETSLRAPKSDNLNNELKKSENQSKVLDRPKFSPIYSFKSTNSRKNTDENLLIENSAIGDHKDVTDMNLTLKSRSAAREERWLSGPEKLSQTKDALVDLHKRLDKLLANAKENL